MAGAGAHMGADGSLMDLAQVLGQVPDTSVTGLGDRAGVGLQQTGHDLQQRRLARPVAAHQRDAATRRQMQGHVLEELADAVGLGQARRGKGHRLTLRNISCLLVLSSPNGENGTSLSVLRASWQASLVCSDLGAVGVGAFAPARALLPGLPVQDLAQENKQ